LCLNARDSSCARTTLCRARSVNRSNTRPEAYARCRRAATKAVGEEALFRDASVAHA